MYVLIAGGGKAGANVMRTLLRNGHEATIIEQDRDRYERLESEFEHQAMHGDATELFVLEPLQRTLRHPGGPRKRGLGLERPFRIDGKRLDADARLLRETAEKMPRCTLRVYDGVGHGVPKERKRRYEEDALAFMGDHRGRLSGKGDRTIGHSDLQ